MDKMNVDSHKLHLHPELVSKWLKHEQIKPIYAELSTSGACNHRCEFCALDYIEYVPYYIDTKQLEIYLKNCGHKAIMLGGEGEPLMHREIIKIINLIVENGIDLGMTTNGVLLDKIVTVWDRFKWIKVSIDAGQENTYRKIRKAMLLDWDKVWFYVEKAAQKTTVGTQFLLLEDNFTEVEKFIQKSKSAGVDYAVVKTYSKHLKSKNMFLPLDPKKFIWLKQYETDEFKVILRSNNDDREYKECYSLPFWCYIKADGIVYNCSAYLLDQRFIIGNLVDGINTMRYWSNIKECRLNCRMNNVNEYLWRLKNPKEHDNFI